MTTISQETLDTSAKAKPNLTLDYKDGEEEARITPSAELYKLLLSDGNSIDNVELVRQDDARIAAGAAHAVQELGLEAMKKHPKLQRVILELPATGKDYFGIAYNRSRQVPDRAADGTRGTKTAYGVMTVDFNMYGTKNRAQLAAVRQAASTAAFDALGS